MARYQVILAYDGTNYKGFQRQAVGPTVQGVVEQALTNLGWLGRSILAAGRTDTGVHASGQVIAFDLEWLHSPGDLLGALNANLPTDIAAQSVVQVEDGFHPRYDATARLYRYRLYCRSVRDPLQERYAWRVSSNVDIELLHSAAEQLVGTHDFADFGTPPRIGGSTIRTVNQANWRQESSLQGDENIVFEIMADAFLYRMVRRLVYFQVQIGQGIVEVSQLTERLILPSGKIIQGLAPAKGLSLFHVEYRIRLSDLRSQVDVH